MENNNGGNNNPQQQFWDFIRSFDPNMQHNPAAGEGHQGNTGAQMPSFPPGFPFHPMQFSGPGGPAGNWGSWDAFAWPGHGGRGRRGQGRGHGGFDHSSRPEANPESHSHSSEQNHQHNDEESEQSEGVATPDTLREGSTERMDYDDGTHETASPQGQVPPPQHAHVPHPPPPHPHAHPHHHPHGGPFGFGPGPHRGRGGCARGRGRGRGGHRAAPGAPWNSGPLYGLTQAFGNHPLAQAARDFLDQAARQQTSEDTDGQDSTFVPAVDTFNTEKAYVLHIALPGAAKDDVGVHWDSDKGALNVAGVVYRPGDEQFLQTLSSSERKIGMFERTIKLPPAGADEKEEIDGYGISAKMENGLLIVTVPKAEKEWTEIHKVDIE